MEERALLISELEYRQNRERSKRFIETFIFLFGIVLAIIGVFFLTLPDFFVEFAYQGSFNSSKHNYDDLRRNFQILGGGSAVFSTVVFSYLFMAGFNPEQIRNRAINKDDLSGESSFENESIAIVALLKSINSSLEKGKIESTLSETERKEVINSISNTVESHLNESLLGKIEEKYGETIHCSKLSDLSMKSLDKTVIRLSQYVKDLTSKATVNLSYGIGATVLAIGTLIFVLFNASSPEGASTIQEVFYYTSRLFLVLMVQGIAIFFLNLYKSTVNNILYLNNEITNYEAKRDSLGIALSSGNLDSASAMLISLSNIERNFTLKKGETSIYDKGGVPLQSPISESSISELLAKINAKQN